VERALAIKPCRRPGTAREPDPRSHA